MKALYICYEFLDDKNGGSIGSKMRWLTLLEIFNKENSNILIPKERTKKEILINYLTLSMNGYTREIEKKILQKIQEEKIEKIFIDSSTLGKLCKKIKKMFPKIEIIIFFGNIEKNYIKERIKVEGITRYFLLPSIIYNENLCVKYSDKFILLNKREINELGRIYKNKLKNKKIYEVPLYLEDRYDLTRKLKKCDYDYLFIGSGFYANIHGITWFIENVLPNIKGKLLVIGKGMEILKERYKNTEKLEIRGTVENIDDYYYEDNIVISPIFYGSGMKTKTIEAMMFNKVIYGTSEAFVGIEKEDINSIGELCNTKNEFIEKLKKIENKEENSRNIYLNKYSSEVSIENIRKIVEEKI